MLASAVRDRHPFDECNLISRNPSHRTPPTQYPAHFPVGTELDVTWAVAFQPIPPVCKATAQQARLAPLSLTSPGLLIGISAAPAPNDTDAGICHADLDRLSRVVQPNLEAMLIALSLHHKQQKGRPIAQIPEHPAWSVIFGVFERKNSVAIVAHFPAFSKDGVLFEYHSVLVDELPFPPCHTDDESADGQLARFRLAIALLTIRRHVTRLTTIWDGTIFDHIIMVAERELLRETSGIKSPQPSDEGSVCVHQLALAMLFRGADGSDVSEDAKMAWEDLDEEPEKEWELDEEAKEEWEVMKPKVAQWVKSVHDIDFTTIDE